MVLNLHEVYVVNDKMPDPETSSFTLSASLFIGRHVMGTMGAPLIIGYDNESEDQPFGAKRRVPQKRDSDLSFSSDEKHGIPSLPFPPDIKIDFVDSDDAEKGSVASDYESEVEVTVIG